MNNLTEVDDLQEKRMSGKESWLLKKAVRPEGGGYKEGLDSEPSCCWTHDIYLEWWHMNRSVGCSAQ